MLTRRNTHKSPNVNGWKSFPARTSPPQGPCGGSMDSRSQLSSTSVSKIPAEPEQHSGSPLSSTEKRCSRAISSRKTIVGIFAFPGNFPIETLTMWSLTHRDHRQEDTCLARDTGDEDARDYARWSYQESRLCRHKGIHRWQH